MTAGVRELGLTNVKMLPYQDKARLSESLSAAHVSLILQRESTRGLVVPSKLYGILASGRAAVAAVPAGSEVARVVANERVGRVVPPEDPGAIAAAVRALHEGRRETQAMGRRGRNVAVRDYDRRVVTRRYVQLFESLRNV